MKNTKGIKTKLKKAMTGLLAAVVIGAYIVVIARYNNMRKAYFDYEGNAAATIIKVENTTPFIGGIKATYSYEVDGKTYVKQASPIYMLDVEFEPYQIESVHYNIENPDEAIISAEYCDAFKVAFNNATFALLSLTSGALWYKILKYLLNIMPKYLNTKFERM